MSDHTCETCCLDNSNDELREQNAKLQAAISDILTCNFTAEKCPECYGKARLLVSEGDILSR